MQKRASKGVSPRLIILAMIVIIAVGAAIVFASLPEPLPEGVGLAGFPDGSTDDITYAGRFPAVDQPALKNPLGIDTDGERIYVAESEAGAVAVFTLDGGRLADIPVPAVEGRTDVYVLDVAIVDESRIAVIDSASSRVLLLSIDGPELITVIGRDSTLPGQPTALAVADGELYVADGETGLIMVFSMDDGKLVRSLGEGLAPSLTYPGGMFLADDGLHVADSNAGRVLVLNAETGDLVRILPDRYSLPRGIVGWGDAEEFVTDTFAAAVVAVGEDGVRLFGTDDVTESEAALASPRDVCWVAESGRLYVTDADAGEVVVYNIRFEETASE